MMARAKPKPAPELPPDARAHDRVRKRDAAGLTTATAERLIQAGPDGFEHTQTNVQRIVEAPLDRLWRAGSITRREFEAGDKYRSDAYLAAVDPTSGSVDWSRTGGGMTAKVPSVFSTQAIADARIRFRQIEARMPDVSTVKKLLFEGLIREWPLEQLGALFGRRGHEGSRAAGLAGLRVALASLADHYGM
jgi:hypothetical protein